MKKKLLLGAILLSSFCSFAQVALSEGFEGGTFPPEGWTTVDTNPTNNWVLNDNPDYVVAGNYSAAVNWIAEDQDESLISPSFSLEGYTTAYFNYTVIVGYDYMAGEFASGDLFAKISIDGGTTWTELWVEEDEGVYEDYVPITKHLDISDYVGETDVMIKFQYVANDADLVVVDEISVSACPGLDITNLAIDELTDTSASFTFTPGASSSYDIEWGEIGFELGTGMSMNVTTGTFEFSPLDPGTGYAFYIRPNCTETSYGQWEGPYTFYSTLSTAVDLDYAYGFEDVPFAAAGWSTLQVAATGGAWGRYTGDETIPTQEGDYMAGVIGVAGATDAWLFSRGLNLTEGDEVTLRYYIKKVALAGNGNVNNLTVTFGNDKTAAAQTTTLNTHDNIAETEFTQKTAVFTAPSTGVYYVGFHSTSPAHSATNQGALLLDGVTFDSALGVNDFLASQLSIYPNPASDVINITNAENILINGVEIVDLNGRVVKSAKFNGVTEAQINISELSSGMYLMNVSSDQGTTTKKIVKK